MKAIMKNDTIEEIDTSFMFNNQYITIDEKRIYDTSIKQIIDDIRLGEFYCSSNKQGTYEEVQKAIDEERAKINQCDGCFWHQIDGRIENECHKEEQKFPDKLVINETTAYNLKCSYDYNNGKCVHDINEKPILFRDATDCYFCKHPEGIPDMTDFIHFMLINHEKYGIVPIYESDEEDFGQDLKGSFIHDKIFGSYLFEKSWSNYFKLSNARHSFSFIYDFKNQTFILIDGIGYKEVKVFTTSEYNYKTQKNYEKTITNFDKFYTWFSAMANDFVKSTQQ